MRIESRLTMERALGILQGVAYTLDAGNGIIDALEDVTEMLNAVMREEGTQ